MDNKEEVKGEAFNRLLEILQSENIYGFRERFLDMHPYDQALFFTEVEKMDRMLIYSYLSPEEVAAMMGVLGLKIFNHSSLKWIRTMLPWYLLKCRPMMRWTS